MVRCKTSPHAEEIDVPAICALAQTENVETEAVIKWLSDDERFLGITEPG